MHFAVSHSCSEAFNYLKVLTLHYLTFKMQEFRKILSKFWSEQSMYAAFMLWRADRQMQCTIAKLSSKPQTWEKANNVQELNLRNLNVHHFCVAKYDQYMTNSAYFRTMSKPKLNQQLSSTEFEVRLHSYRHIHPPHHTNSPCPASRGPLCTTVQSQTSAATLNYNCLSLIKAR